MDEIQELWAVWCDGEIPTPHDQREFARSLLENAPDLLTPELLMTGLQSALSERFQYDVKGIIR